MNFLIKLADGLTGIVGAGGENLVGLITGVLPNVLILKCINLINPDQCTRCINRRRAC